MCRTAGDWTQCGVIRGRVRTVTSKARTAQGWLAQPNKGLDDELLPLYILY
jgi:hypothetical protein